jgi:hypothetical protein
MNYWQLPGYYPLDEEGQQLRLKHEVHKSTATSLKTSSSTIRLSSGTCFLSNPLKFSHRARPQHRNYRIFPTPMYELRGIKGLPG